jgi:FKBP-type peptidyl-prolyl cis-trans isomerase FklB
MKYILVLSFSFFLISCSQSNKPSVTTFETKKDSISYSIGMEIGMNFQSQSVEVNSNIFAQGFHDSYTESTPLLEDSVMRRITQNYRQELRLKQDEKRKQQLEENTVGGEKFLAENSTKEGVIVLPSGLQYKVINNGDGSIPKTTDKVKVHYTGKLIDGTVFDSSVERGEPSTFGVTQVIKGWTEALQLMRVGDKWEVYIPSNLAYGVRGKGPKIGPNTTLVFEVELLGIEN